MFTTTYGASEDIENEDYRRMLLNACVWALGMEDKIEADMKIEFVGPYQPTTFSFDGHRKNVQPKDIAGWDSPILPQK